MAEEIVWRNARTPESVRFGDVYFSAEDGLAESRHVFLDGIGVPGLWAGRDRVCLGETGFGTGLNFLLTWRAWRQTAAAFARLDYVSVEAYPLNRDQLARALAAFPDLAPEAGALLASWPAPHPGHHRVSFDDGRVVLHLLLGPVEARLSGLRASVDAWYLDGFAPSRNPEMWTEAVFAQVARLSAPGARLATFTTAGHVRRGLAAAGFRVGKRPGFGRKRECLSAVLETPPAAPDPEPWFRRAAPVPDGPVAVIGGGIGGAAMAHALTRAGRAVVLLEAGPALAREGSGNPSALMKPRLSPGDEPYGRFHAMAFLHAVALYDALAADVWHPGRGVLVAARDAAERATQEEIAATLPWPDGLLRRVEAEEAQTLAGAAPPLGGLWYGAGGCLRPQVLCAALADGAEVRLNTPVGALERAAGGGWLLRDPAGAPLLEAAAVVLCAGAALPDLWPEAAWPLGRNRGQITLLPAVEGGPRAALSFGGYLTAPFTDGTGRRVHALGATYDRWHRQPEDWRPLRDADHARNLDLLAAHLPEVAAHLGAEPVGGRSGLRCTIADHLPLAGPVHDRPAFLAAYARLHHGAKAGPFPPAPLHEGLFVLGALGSRGFQTAPLAAELVAAQIAGGPLPVDAAVAAALHPARHDLRHLRRTRPR